MSIDIVKELIDVLMYQKPLKPLIWNHNLYNLCIDHVNDTGKTGSKSHENSKGIDLNERVQKVGGTTGSLGENLSFGYTDAKEIVLELLIDVGFKTRGHRYNILNKDFQMMGAYSGPHANTETMSCMIYTWDFIDSPKDYATIQSNL